jgi:hypothetical protein
LGFELALGRPHNCRPWNVLRIHAVADGAPNRDARTEFLDIEVTREPEAYLRRGRIHANLPDGELNSLWEAAFVAWFRSRGAEDRLGYYDLDIELELRGLEPPRSCPGTWCRRSLT